MKGNATELDFFFHYLRLKAYILMFNYLFPISRIVDFIRKPSLNVLVVCTCKRRVRS